MRKTCLLILYAIFLTQWLYGTAVAKADSLEYPYYMLDSYNPDDDCWKGMDALGYWPVQVIPERWLVDPPPALDRSGVTLPIDHWVELKFRGGIVDGAGEDLFLVELDAVGEQALVFLTDGFDQEYLLGLAAVPGSGGQDTTKVSFDIAGISLPFVPRAVRIVGVDLRGGSPGFDLAYVRARTSPESSYIACDPSPVDGVENVPIDAVLSWSSGDVAREHVVYFGDTPADAGQDATAVDVPPQPQVAESYNPCDLKLDKTYFWRVDELNNTDANSPWTGDIWKFTTADYFVVDDFESYQRNELRNTWSQTGYAYIQLSEEPGPVHRCQQSLAFSYFCDENFYSEAVYDFNSTQDWASIDARSLELFFRGGVSNDADARMYIALSDGDVRTEVPYDGDANNLKGESWQCWRIDLKDFVDVDLRRVESVSIGFGDGVSTSSGSGVGTVYFDDIRLYPSRCLEENKPQADFNDDCTVNFDDLGEITENWLETGFNTYQVKAPNAPVAWYKFDGDLDDSVGNAHGHMRVNPAYVPGVYGQAISFDGYGSSVEITNVVELFSGIRTGITIAFWQYGDTSPHHTDTLCCSNYVYSVYNPTIAVNLGIWKAPGKYNWDCGSRWSFDGRLSGHHRYNSEWSGRWNHWAFTKDTEAGVMQIFLNGALYDSREDATTPIEGIISFEIGAGWYGGYDGLIDDFRIYDYALSGPEIAYAATNGTGIFDQQLMLEADLNSDNLIDFKDFAILTCNWLEKNLWP
jgi:hypothetical protein